MRAVFITRLVIVYPSEVRAATDIEAGYRKTELKEGIGRSHQRESVGFHIQLS
jgi:hypothetical protein